MARRSTEGAVTLSDVAKLAGTSVATVSYVVNDGPKNVAPATRQRIAEAIATLGYRPNSLAKALRSRESHMIGLLVPGTSDPYFNELSAAVERAAFDAGYLTLLGNSAFDAERELALLEGLLSSQVDGLIFIGLGESKDVSAVVRSSGTPCVSVHHRPPGMPGPFVTVDNRAGARLATEHLLDHGHETVKCFTHTDDLGPVGERVMGWRDALQIRGISHSDEDLVRSRFDRAGASQAAAEWLPTRGATTALFATTDELAVGVLHAASRMGILIPEELAVVGFDGVPERSTTVPELSSIVEPFEKIGRESIRHLLHGSQRRYTFTLPVTLDAATSCGCVDSRANLDRRRSPQ